MLITWDWVKTDKYPLTRAVAEGVAALPHFDGDRPWDSHEGKTRMQWLSRLVDEGKFYPPRWATAELNGKLYRVNGGTSSHMLAARNGKFPLHLEVIIDRFHCDSIGAVADLFDQFDHRRSIRTMGQKVRAHKAVVPELHSVSPTDVSMYITGIAASLSDFRTQDEDCKIGLIHEHASFISWANPMGLVRKPHLRQRGAVAAIFRTQAKDATYARGFWSEVAEQSNPDNTHPTRVLSDFLREQVGLTATKKFDAKTVCIKCVHAWNAARHGRKTALKVYSDRMPEIE